MPVKRLPLWSLVPLLFTALALLVPACSSSDKEGGGSCTTLPALTASELSCDTDQDCQPVWSGTYCSCGCYCADGAAANAAGYARIASIIASLPADWNCSVPRCSCPALETARCIAHQCTACGNPAIGPLSGQPAACTADAGAGDAGPGEGDAGQTD
jgi:hypothetical protein